MLGTSNYTPVARLYIQAKSIINELIRNEHSCTKLDKCENERLSLDAKRYNIEIAAKFLIRDIISRRNIPKKDRNIFFLQQDGAHIRAPMALLFSFDYSFNRDSVYASERKANLSSRTDKIHEYIFGYDTLKENYWRKLFDTENVFELKNEYSIFEIISDPYKKSDLLCWDTGTLHLDKLKSAILACDQMQTALSTMERHGIKPSFGLSNLKRERFITKLDISRNMLKLFSVYDEFPLVVPTTWGNALDELYVPVENNPFNDYKNSPKDEILDLKYEYPNLKKAEIKERLFPTASTRQFDRFWRQAAEESPNLTKPGRRSKQS